MRTTFARYFWNGIVYHDLNKPPYINPPFYGIRWIPPKGMKINPKLIFNDGYNKEHQHISPCDYVKSLTQHGKVIIENLVEWNKDEDTLTIILPDRYLNYSDAKHISKIINSLGTEYKHHNEDGIDFYIYEFINTANGKYGLEFTLRIDNKIRCAEFTTILDKKTTIYLKEIDKNIDTFKALILTHNNVIIKNINKYIKSIKTNNQYTISDLLKLGNLTVNMPEYANANSGLFTLTRFNDNNYILFLPFINQAIEDNDGIRQMVIRNKVYSPSGSVIFQLVSYYMPSQNPPSYKSKTEDLGHTILRKNNYLRIEDVVLIGKEYTGQWWMHHLPPFYANLSIQACERWIFNITKDDKIIKEA